MKKHCIFIAAIFIAAMLSANPQPELRAVKITNVDSDVMFSDRNIADGMAYLDSINVNIVLVCVWNSNGAGGDYTLFPSDEMMRYFGESYHIHPAFSGRDPLQTLIVEAHARGIEVMPWYEMGFSTSWNQNGGYILDKYPDWALKTSSDDLCVKNGFDWMSAINPECNDFIRKITLEACKKYDIDGIEYSDRIPAMPVEGGYDEATASLYRSEHDGQSPPSNYDNTEWKRWRADKMTRWYQSVRDSIKAIDPNMHVSSSPSVYPWSYEEYLQDPKTWRNNNICDDVIPQLYRKTYSEYESTFFNSIANYNDDSRVFSGVCLYQRYSDFTGREYLMNADYIMNMLQLNRNNGIQGEAWFFFEGLDKEFRDFDTAIAPGNPVTVGDTLLATYYAEKAPLPHRLDTNWRPVMPFIPENDPHYTEASDGWNRPAEQHLNQIIFRGNNILYSTGSDTLSYYYDIPESGNYHVYIYNPRFSNASREAIYLVGSDTFKVNQQTPESSGWRRLTTRHFEAGIRLPVLTVLGDAPDGKPVLADDMICLPNRNSYLGSNPESARRPISEPETCRLLPNYPNPFNVQTRIRFALDQSADIELTIVTIHGKLVRRFVSSQLDAGLHQVIWDGLSDNGNSVPSGIYVCILKQNGQFVESQKMCLLK